MGDKIVLNIADFDAANSGIHSVITDLNTVKSNLEKCNSVLSEKWKGKSSERFFKIYNGLNKEFEVYIKELSKLADNLKEIKTTFVEKDNELDSFIKKHEVKNEDNDKNFNIITGA